MSRVFKHTAEVTLGEPVKFDGHVLPRDIHRPAAVAVLTVRTGAAEVTLYPSPLALDQLADELRDLADAVRELRERAASPSSSPQSRSALGSPTDPLSDDPAPNATGQGRAGAGGDVQGLDAGQGSPSAPGPSSIAAGDCAAAGDAVPGASPAHSFTTFDRRPDSSGGEEQNPGRPPGTSTAGVTSLPGDARRPNFCPSCEGGGTRMHATSPPDRFGLVDTDEFTCDQCDGTGEQQ